MHINFQDFGKVWGCSGGIRNSYQSSFSSVSRMVRVAAREAPETGSLNPKP